MSTIEPEEQIYESEQLTYRKEQERSAHLAQGLRRLANSVSKIVELEANVCDIRDEAQHVEEGRFTIVVVGAFNRGKSTFLNAMVGDELLPTAAVPSTAIITLLRHDLSEQILVHFTNGNSSDPLSVDDFKKQYVLPVADQIEAQVADLADDEEALEEQRLRAARDAFSHIDYAEARLPLGLCQHGVEFVDTPGFEDDDTRTKRARSFVEESDAVVFLLDATQPVTHNDVRTLDWIMSRGDRAIFFVINKWNILEIMERLPAGRQKVEQRFRAKLAKYVTENGVDAYDSRVFKVNAVGALEARTSQLLNLPDLEESGISSFEQTLERFLVERRLEARDKALVSKARNFCNDLDSHIKRRLDLRQRGLDDLMDARNALQPKLEQLRGVRRHIEEFIDGHKIRIQKMLAESLGKHMATLDTNNIVYEQLDLSEITDAWLAAEGLKDATRSALESVGILDKDETKRFEARVRRSLEPQIYAILEEEMKQWELTTATIQMKTEGHKLVEYLKEEAADFQRILREIGQILENQDDQTITVEDLVNEWLKTAIARRSSVGVAKLDASGMAIDLSPMLGAVAVEIAFHLKGLVVPVVGTIISALLAIWRQRATIKKIKQGIENGLSDSLAKIPNAEQRRRIDNEVAMNFDALKRTVLPNINVQIGTIDRSLESAIADVEQGDFDAKAEQQELAAMQEAARRELAEIEQVCAV